MSMKLFELKQQHKHALDKADSIVAASESAGRDMSKNEQLDFETCMAAASSLAPRIAALEKNNSLHTLAKLNGGMLLAGNADQGDRRIELAGQKTLSSDYTDAFYSYVSSGGKQMEAALYEGSMPGGGYAVPIRVDDQIVPLAPSEMAIRRLATVVPTNSDIKVPIKGSFGTANTKAENAAFTESDPTLGQFELSAFMLGIQETVSWELAQDVPSFQAFCVDDMLLAVQMREEGFFVGGTGSGQPQGLIGNVGAGVTEEPDGSGNLVSIDGTLDLTGTLNAVYHPGASWLMQRATSIIIRKAQRQANLFEPVFTRVGNQDYLHGYPVEYSASMPAAARSACPILFGNFKAGYVIGDRGGSGINVKVLDQPQAQQGQIVLLAYRRYDGRVRRSEAIQSYNVAAS